LFSLDDFLAHLRVERGLAENSVEAYRRDLEQLGAFLGTGAGHPDAVTTADLRDFLRQQVSRGQASSTVSRKLSAVRSYFAFLRREGVVEANPAASLRGSTPRRRLPNVLSRMEVERLLSAPSETTASGMRDAALLELLYSCGLRVSEALGLTFDDLALAETFVRVRGKGDKERLVPFGDRAAERLGKYLAEGRPHLARTGRPVPALFLNGRGTPLSRVACFKSLRAYWKAVGGRRPISPHTLRHTFATHLVDGGADIRFVQELLGHADVATTEIYTHVSRERLRRDFLRFHPREGDGEER